MATARDELHRLADSLPDPAVEELASVGRTLEQQVSAGENEEVMDPQEAEIVRHALGDTGDEPDFTPERARATSLNTEAAAPRGGTSSKVPPRGARRYRTI
jgi:hypothetical protein